jgi:hypothetical protein
MLACVVGIAVLALLSFHVYLVLGGWTTIELLEKKNKRSRQNPEVAYRNPYDLGCYRNFTRVFGSNPLLWLIPTRRSVPGDGVFFATNARPDLTGASAAARGGAGTYGAEDPLEH